MRRWRDDGGGAEGADVEADHNGGRAVECLLETGKGGGRMGSKSFQIEYCVCNLGFGEQEREPFVFRMGSYGG